ncbi:hypothetical protein [Neisseria sicca]|uniref:hypothetical protein n=1 Tax=Neisseria sicca TaxID=490 RepID=UPI0012DC7133|nr:hypothetical protein [Neisseria sicca]
MGFKRIRVLKLPEYLFAWIGFGKAVCRLLFGFQTTYDTVWSSETFIAVLFYRSICDTSRTAPLSAEVAIAP